MLFPFVPLDTNFQGTQKTDKLKNSMYLIPYT